MICCSGGGEGGGTFGLAVSADVLHCDKECIPDGSWRSR